MAKCDLKSDTKNQEFDVKSDTVRLHIKLKNYKEKIVWRI